MMGGREKLLARVICFFLNIICTKYFEADLGGDVNICGTTTNLKQKTRKERSTQPGGGLMSIYTARSLKSTTTQAAVGGPKTF